jgi:hypothetical protein
MLLFLLLVISNHILRCILYGVHTSWSVAAGGHAFTKDERCSKRRRRGHGATWGSLDTHSKRTHFSSITVSGPSVKSNGRLLQISDRKNGIPLPQLSDDLWNPDTNFHKRWPSHCQDITDAPNPKQFMWRRTCFGPPIHTFQANQRLNKFFLKSFFPF